MIHLQPLAEGHHPPCIRIYCGCLKLPISHKSYIYEQGSWSVCWTMQIATAGCNLLPLTVLKPLLFAKERSDFRHEPSP